MKAHGERVIIIQDVIILNANDYHLVVKVFSDMIWRVLSSMGSYLAFGLC